MKKEVVFPVVGSKYVLGGLDIASSAMLGDILELIPETENQDEYAIAVFCSGKKMGYIPNKGISCPNCWIHVDKGEFCCSKCGTISFVPGGLARRLTETKVLEKPHACFVSGKDQGGIPVRATLILE